MRYKTLIVGLAVIAGGAASAYAPAGDYIAGRVTDERTGEPLPNICVSAVAITDGRDWVATTQRDGSYLIDDLEPGEYEVTFDPCSYTPFASEAYNDRPGAEHPFFDPFSESRPLAMDLIEPPASGIDAALGPAGYISGRITDAATGEPLAGRCVWPGHWSGPTGTGPPTKSRVDGSYSIAVPFSGVTRIAFSDCELNAYKTFHLNSQYYDRAHDGLADLVTVNPPDLIHLDAVLVSTGSLSGRLRDRLTGDPIGGVCVSVSPVETKPHGVFGYGNFYKEARTNPRGRFTLPDLAPGAEYLVSFSIDCSRRAVFYGSDRVVNTYDVDVMRVTPVKVRAGRSTRIDSDLFPYGRISGTVHEAATGRPLAGACVLPIALRGDLDLANSLTDAFGRYTFELPPGPYAIRFAQTGACEATVDETRVRVRPGRTTGGIDGEV